MKLSKAQQEVVDKMRDGAVIKYYGSDNPVKLELKNILMPVHRSTFLSLHRLWAIEHVEGSSPRTYRLTEQYKTKPE